MKLIHKYARRLIRWASQPSDEDLIIHAKVCRNSEIERERRCIKNMLRSSSLGVTPALIGLNKSGVKDAIALIFEVWRDLGEVSDERAAMACDQICHVNSVSLAQLVRSGEIQWPLSCGYDFVLKPAANSEVSAA